MKIMITGHIFLLNHQLSRFFLNKQVNLYEFFYLGTYFILKFILQSFELSRF
jgi:hypothetical protein